MKKALVDEFTADNFTLTPTDNVGLQFMINLEGAYALAMPADKNTEDDGNQQPEQSKAIKVATAKEIQEELKGLLENGVHLTLNAEKKGFKFHPRKSGSNLVTVQCTGKAEFEEALACIEPGYHEILRIVNLKDYIFEVGATKLAIPKKEQDVRTVCYNFLRNLKQATRGVIPVFNVMGSYVLAAYKLSTTSAADVAWKISFTDKGDAISASRFYEEYFPDPQVDGHFLSIRTKLSTIRECSEGKLAFAKYSTQVGTIVSDMHTARRLSTDYTEFHLLDFNRKVNKRRVAHLRALIKMWGFFGSIIVVETDIIDGVMKKWIVDGQHRFEACKFDGLPIRYETITGIKTKYDLVRLIAELNSSSKTWSSIEYLESWAKIGLPEYVTLLERFRSTKIPMMMLAQMYEGEDVPRKTVQDKFRIGNLRINDPLAENLIANLYDVQKDYLPKNRDLSMGLYTFMKEQKENYDNERMRNRLARLNGNLPFNKGDTLEQVTEQFRKIYVKK